MMYFPKYEEYMTPEQREKLDMLTNAKKGMSPIGGTGRLMKNEKRVKNRKNRKR